MPVAKKATSKKKPARKSGPVRPKVKSSQATKAKYALPSIETTALEKSLEPDEKKKKVKLKKPKPLKIPLVLPGYVAFTAEVWRTLWKFKSTFWRLVTLYTVLSGVFVGLASQEIYTQISSLLRETGGQALSGDTAKFGEAADLLLTSLTGGANQEAGEMQQLIGSFLVILVWLTIVWLLRAFLAGHTPRLRDGLYNSGSPLVPTLMLGFLFIVQLLPAAIAAIAVSALLPTGIISGGILIAVFWLVALLLAVLSLYWITSTFIALIVVTLPGMYPMKALSTARELVAGRRLRIMLRMVWLAVLSLVLWSLIMIPIIIFDAWIKGVLSAIEWVPLVPVAFLIVSSLTVVWTASYSYLLYRKIVDGSAAA